MYEQVEKPKENKSRAVAQQKSIVRHGVSFVDNRHEAITQRKLQEIVNDSPQAKQAAQLKTMSINKPNLIQRARLGERTLGMIEGNIDNNTSSPTQLEKMLIQRVKAPKKKNKAKKKWKPDFNKQTMTVRNKKNSYTTGWINSLSYAAGVDAGPRAEAQKVAKFFGGSWVGGHMINDQLGGDGGYGNIAPITSSMNGLHRFIENKANNYLSSGLGNQIQYKMKVLKRATVKNTYKTVKNLPIEFQQTLDVHLSDGTNKTHTGHILQETNPGNGTIQP